MSNNPYKNAFTALAYIALVALLLFNMPKIAGGDDNFLTPIVALSFFTLSAAIMGYLFLYTPLLLIVEGKKQEATRLFLTTVAVFAGCTATVFCAMLALSWFLEG